MTQIVRDNKVFFYFFLNFFLVGLILLTQIQQGDAILFFSDNRSSFGDLFFSYFTKMGEEAIYIISILLLLFYRFRYVLLIPLMALLTLIISFASKSFFAHDRPAVYFQKLGIFDQINFVDGINLLHGPTSFPSGHTMSAFAMYGFLALVLPRKRSLPFLLFLAALFVGISRMYLVQHFLKDVVTGAAIGTLLALTVYYLQARVPYDSRRFIDRSLSEIWRSKK